MYRQLRRGATELGGPACAMQCGGSCDPGCLGEGLIPVCVPNCITMACALACLHLLGGYICVCRCVLPPLGSATCAVGYMAAWCPLAHPMCCHALHCSLDVSHQVTFWYIAVIVRWTVRLRSFIYRCL